MRITLVGPGIMPIPPNGWGALERQIWDRAKILTKLHHKVTIINTPDTSKIIEECIKSTPDVVHVHYDVFYQVVETLSQRLKCPILFSSHYPYIDQPSMHKGDGYEKILEFLLKKSDLFYNFAVSPKDYDFFREKKVPENRLFWLMEGTNDVEFAYNESCELKNKSIYLGKISERKKQYIYQSIPNIDFVGRYDGNTSFDSNNNNYKGEWDREILCKDLTKYANMILLSDGENGTSLAIKEALVVGLGVVISRHSASEVDTTKPFVTVIPDNKLTDISYVTEAIESNRQISVVSRKEIRDYGMKTFSLENLIKKYIFNIESIK